MNLANKYQYLFKLVVILPTNHTFSKVTHFLAFTPKLCSFALNFRPVAPAATQVDFHYRSTTLPKFYFEKWGSTDQKPIANTSTKVYFSCELFLKSCQARGLPRLLTVPNPASLSNLWLFRLISRQFRAEDTNLLKSGNSICGHFKNHLICLCDIVEFLATFGLRILIGALNRLGLICFLIFQRCVRKQPIHLSTWNHFVVLCLKIIGNLHPKSTFLINNC